MTIPKFPCTLFCMSSFLLVHGAWQSAATWDLVTPLLESGGHDVVTPVLAGLGTDQSRLSPNVSLSQHIDGIAAELSKSPEPVILVGHSYAGMIISGAAGKNPHQVRRLVFVDAFIPEDGQSVMDLLPPEVGAHFRNVAREHGDGWRLPAGESQLDLWGLKPGEAREFVRARLCDFSIHCFEEPVRLPVNRKATLPATYLACVADGYPAKPFFQPFALKARALGWPVVELDTGHDCHVEKPREVADLLLSLSV